jgi:hypothetical protein
VIEEQDRQQNQDLLVLMKCSIFINRKSLWRILRAYGIPKEIAELIKSFFYNNCTCSVGYSNTWFAVERGERQGSVMSALLFNLIIDWVMNTTTEDAARGIRWNISSTLEDLDFADDLALLSRRVLFRSPKIICFIQSYLFILITVL